jgi:hypothetical protein
MEGKERKAAVAAYKQRKVFAGVYAVRCTTTGERWIGRAPDLSTIQNRIWFALRHDGSRSASLQSAWNRYGEAHFVLEELERLDEDILPMSRDRLLKERLAYWREQFGAEGI